MLFSNEHLFAVHALKNARLHLIRRQNPREIPLRCLFSEPTTSGHGAFPKSVSHRFLLQSIPLAILCCISGLGCDGKAGRDAIAPRLADGDATRGAGWAVQVAESQLVKESPSLEKYQVNATPEENGDWSVMFEMLPPTPGAHTLVTVHPDGSTEIAQGE